MSTETIEIHVPEGLYRRLERLAALTRRPLEGLILQTLSSSIPPLPDDLPPATRDALIAIEALSDEELVQVVRRTMPDDRYQRLSELREKRREDTLPEGETAELDHLLEEADLLTLTKAYAAVLLKLRGHKPAPLAEADA
jgi:hypothetical protein